MKPFIVLLGTFCISLIVLKFTIHHFDFSLAARIGMCVMLCFTAIGHFAFSKGMSMMIPDFIPFKTELVYFTGILEIF
jgi:drug/metabolite transporter (DMT)-like permease